MMILVLFYFLTNEKKLNMIHLNLDLFYEICNANEKINTLMKKNHFLSFFFSNPN